MHLVNNRQSLSPALRQLYDEVDRTLARAGGEGRPRIAITAHSADGRSALAFAYSEAVQRAGGIPLIVPITEDTEVLLEMLRQVDGLLLSGGADLDPRYMGEEPVRGLGVVQSERDSYELRVVRIAHRLSLPMLGICRGHQVLGVAYGSTLFQDLISQYNVEGALDHAPEIARTRPHHRLLFTESDSRLYDILQLEDGDDPIWVNSLHHQALREVCSPFVEVAIASDGVNEAIDAYPERDILSVQWHPEQMIAGGDARQLLLFRHLIERSRLYRQAREFHRKTLVLDSHTDTPMFFCDGFDIGDSRTTRVDLTRMELGDVSASVMVAYLPQGEISDAAHAAARTLAEEKLSELHRQVARYPERAMIARTPAEIQSRGGRRAIIPAIENGYAIGTDIELLRYYRDKYSIAYITLCHNGDNALCDSARRSQRTHGGLSSLGREVIREMNRLGIVIDVSHAGEETVRDVLEISTTPVIASHSSARSLCDHERNLSDEQIVAIAMRGGVIQVCLYAGFIHQDPQEASFIDAVDHIDHIVSLVGIDHVGIGSDFDGDGELIGCRTSEDLIRITMLLIERGYGQEDLAALWGGNFLRVLSEVQQAVEIG